MGDKLTNKQRNKIQAEITRLTHELANTKTKRTHKPRKSSKVVVTRTIKVTYTCILCGYKEVVLQDTPTTYQGVMKDPDEYGYTRYTCWKCDEVLSQKSKTEIIHLVKALSKRVCEEKFFIKSYHRGE